MRPCFLAVPLAASLAAPAAAATLFSQTWTTGFADNGVVPDGNPLGWSDARTLSGVPIGSLSNVSVSLTVAGGAVGDLFVYLSNGSHAAILLNRPGKTAVDDFGFEDAGFTATFADGGPLGDSHLAFTGSNLSLTSAWEPDARTTDPYLVTDSSPRTNFLSGFQSFPADGTWTLFVADLIGGGDDPIVTSWTLSLESADSPSAVPEPSQSLAAALAAAFAAATITRRRRSNQTSR